MPNGGESCGLRGWRGRGSSAGNGRRGRHWRFIEKRNVCSVDTYDLVMRLLLVGFVMALPAADWPQFRGPAANPVGESAKLADKWSKTENVEWMAEVPGRGWSSPVVSGGKVFLTTVTTEGKSKAPQT